MADGTIGRVNSSLTDLKDILLILDMFHLLETDDVVDRKNLQGKIISTGFFTAQCNSGKGS